MKPSQHRGQLNRLAHRRHPSFTHPHRVRTLLPPHPQTAQPADGLAGTTIQNRSPDPPGRRSESRRPERTWACHWPRAPGNTAQKIEEFYGVRQVPEGLLFVAHFPNANSVGIAGDFNNWTPTRMASDREQPGHEADDTFRALVALKPGRYRYRLVVDGRWQADPHNVCAEPNPFGEVDSVVEVV